MSSPLSSSLSVQPDLAGPWQRTAAYAGLLGTDGRLSTTIFTEMTMLARQLGAINLGQGFPDEDGPRCPPNTRSSSRTRPWAISSSTSLDTVERVSPVAVATSARERGEGAA